MKTPQRRTRAPGPRPEDKLPIDLALPVKPGQEVPLRIGLAVGTQNRQRFTAVDHVDAQSLADNCLVANRQDLGRRSSFDLSGGLQA